MNKAVGWAIVGAVAVVAATVGSAMLLAYRRRGSISGWTSEGIFVYFGRAPSEPATVAGQSGTTQPRLYITPNLSRVDFRRMPEFQLSVIR